MSGKQVSCKLHPAAPAAVWSRAALSSARERKSELIEGESQQNAERTANSPQSKHGDRERALLNTEIEEARYRESEILNTEIERVQANPLEQSASR